MKITIEDKETKHLWESTTDGHTIDEVVQQIKGLLVAAGYHPHTVEAHFCEDSWSWFTEEEIFKKRNKHIGSDFDDYLKEEETEDVGKI